MLHKFILTITPLNICKTETTTHSNQSVIIKINSLIAKSSSLHQPIKLEVSVSLDQTTNKYSPVKAIIKIYDVFEGQKEIINCVGAFQISEIEDLQTKEKIIHKLIGTTTIVMEISAQRIDEEEEEAIKSNVNEDNLSLQSSQNLALNSEGAPNDNHHGFIEECPKIRRTNTLGTGEIVDLKSAVNFGAATSKCSASSGSKLLVKASNLHDKNANKIKEGKLIQRSSLEIPQKIILDEDDDFGNMEISVMSNSCKDEKLQQNKSNFGMPALDKQSSSNLSLEESNCNDITEKQQNLDHSSFMYKSGKLEMIDNIKENKVANSVKIEPCSWTKDGEEAKGIVNGIFNLKNLPHIQRVNSSEDIQLTTPIPINYGDLSMSTASITPEVMQEYLKLEIETLGEHLIQERRKNVEIEEKLRNLSYRACAFRDKYLSLQEEWNNWCTISDLFLNNVCQDANGQYSVEFNTKNKDILIKYNFNKQSESAFTNFMACTVENTRQNRKNETAVQVTEFKSRSLREVSDTRNIDSFSIKQKEEGENKINFLTDKLNKLQDELNSREKFYEKIDEEKKEFNKLIEHLRLQLETNLGINTSLKDKVEEMEMTISQKGTMIENMKKTLQNKNNEMDELEDQMQELRKSYENKELMLEEMREELADREEIIEMYKESYGEINRYPSKLQETNIHKCIQNIIDKNNKFDASIMPKHLDLSNGEISPINKITHTSENQPAVLSKRSDSANSDIFSVEESIALDNSFGGKLSLNRKSLGNLPISPNERELRSDRGLLVSLIRNQERINKMKLEEAKGAHKEITAVSNKIEEYIQKLLNEATLYKSVK